MARSKAGDLQPACRYQRPSRSVVMCPMPSLNDQSKNPEAPGWRNCIIARPGAERGVLRSHCVLLYHAPLSHLGRERLGINAREYDGS